MRLAILTVSTAGARGERSDGSGDAIVSWARDRKHDIVDRRLVADDVLAIVDALTTWCDAERVDVVLTTGGTGLSPTDRTPEATRAVIEREAPGIAEWIRASAAPRFPRAVLARGIAGVRSRTLIVNLPGSPGGVTDALVALDPILDHAVAVVRGDVPTHDPVKP